jgi:hypothetical protein
MKKHRKHYTGRESCHPEEAFAGAGADLGAVTNRHSSTRSPTVGRRSSSRTARLPFSRKPGPTIPPPVSLRRARLTAGWRPSGVSLTKLPTPDYSPRTSLLASGESRGPRISAFVWVTGSLRTRQERFGRCLTRIHSKASGIERYSGSSRVAGCVGERRQK